jgi:hypothetical protein
MTEQKPANAGGKQGGRFPRGQSGNPSGKPKGARHKTTMLAEKLMRDDAAQIVRGVIDAAKGGDMTAAKIILDRIAPLRKGRPIYLDLPAMENAAGIAAATAALVAAMGAGELTPDEAATIASVFELRRRAMETGELEQRLAALEGRKDK